MDCKEFREKVNDFILDKIESYTEIEDFLKHFHSCRECQEELRLYYMVRRGLGDVESPVEEEMTDVNEELDLLISYYEDLFRMQRIRRKIMIIAILATISIVGVCAGILFFSL